VCVCVCVCGGGYSLMFSRVIMNNPVPKFLKISALLFNIKHVNHVFR